MPAFAATMDKPAVRKADAALLATIANNDRRALGRISDLHFNWTDSAGNTQKRAALLKALLTAADQRNAEATVHCYGRVAMVRSQRGNVHALRIWAKRARA